MLMITRLRRPLSLGMLLIGIILLIWASMPARYKLVLVTLTPADMQLASSNDTEAHAILEERLVRLEWPSVLRIGDEYQMQLDFIPVEKEVTSSGQTGELIDIYTDHNILTEATYEVAGIRVNPSRPTRESLLPNHAVNFTWMIRADRSGWYDGVVWLSLRYLPLDGSDPSQAPVFVRQLRLHASSFLGLSAPAARLLGGAGMILGVGSTIGDMISLVRGMKKRNSTKVTKDTKDI